MLYVVFLKVTTFLWIILMLHPGYASLFLETITIKFMGPRDLGPRKTNIPKSNRKLNQLFFISLLTFSSHS